MSLSLSRNDEEAVDVDVNGEEEVNEIFTKKNSLEINLEYISKTILTFTNIILSTTIRMINTHNQPTVPL